MTARPATVDSPPIDLTTAEGVGTTPYYVALGRACDWIFRCRDCRRLVVAVELATEHACLRCGGRKMGEVRQLSTGEWLRLRLGLIDFPYRAAFLAEFPGPIARWRARRARAAR